MQTHLNSSANQRQKMATTSLKILIQLSRAGLAWYLLPDIYQWYQSDIYRWKKSQKIMIFFKISIFRLWMETIVKINSPTYQFEKIYPSFIEKKIQKVTILVSMVWIHWRLTTNGIFPMDVLSIFGKYQDFSQGYLEIFRKNQNFGDY